MRLAEVFTRLFAVVAVAVLNVAIAQRYDDGRILIDPTRGISSATVAYSAGGRHDASANMGSCVGFINYPNPDHVLEVTRDALLEISVRSREDTTLLVLRDGAVAYCNDDGPDGVDPFIAERFSAGVYHIYVGTYRLLRSYPDYTLTVQSR